MTRAPYVHYLDGWRGLAILFLLIGHFFPIDGINLGHLGVNLFFVLSGLLMARLLFVYEVPFGEFYQRRISRIFPTMMVFLLVLVGLRMFSGDSVPWIEVAAAAAFV